MAPSGSEFRVVNYVKFILGRRCSAGSACKTLTVEHASGNRCFTHSADHGDKTLCKQMFDEGEEHTSAMDAMACVTNVSGRALAQMFVKHSLKESSKNDL